jgi:hexosaminidase
MEAKVLPTENFDGILYKVESKNKNGKIEYIPSSRSSSILNYEKPILIKENVNQMSVSLVQDKTELSRISQSFHFNKATGKKITLVNQPSKSYPGDGAFTLVNGVQNEKGMARSSEFLGFLGSDLDATIDFGKDIEISKISLHCLNQNNSWIYLPSEIEVSFIPYIDTTIVTRHPPIVSLFKTVSDKNNTQILQLTEPKTCRSIRIVAKNFGNIPAGNPGQGEKAWLFVDEIEVE